ncbi:MAG: inositol monophosphatase family protein [Candidatus Levyibacteriota bacterium]
MNKRDIIEVAYDAVIEAALQATEEIIPFWPNPQNNRFNRKLALEVIDKEGTGNYATIADLKSEKKIIEVIQSKPLLNNHSFLSEESEAIEADENWRWIIDPIDGTPNFRNGNPDFGMCIALFNGQQPILGLIAMPGLRQMVVAKNGEDAKLLNYEGKELANLKELAQQYSDPLDKALVGYDLGYNNRAGQLQEIADKLITKVGYASVLASFSTGNFRLVQGMMGLYFGMSPTIMDIAPAVAIIPAVGGVVTDMEGKPIDWLAESRSYIGAVNPQIHQQFLDALNS